MVKKYTLEKGKKIYSFWGSHSFWYKIVCFFTFFGRENKLRRKAVQKLNVSIGSKVLDLACGTGANFSFIQGVIGGEGRLVGFDYSEKMLEAARGEIKLRGWQNVDLIWGDAAKLSLPNESFDGVISTLGISATPDFKRAIVRAKDVLRDNGRLVVLDAKPFGGIWRVFNPIIKFLYAYGANWDYEKDIVGAMKEVFSKVEIEKFLGGAFYVVVGHKT